MFERLHHVDQYLKNYAMLKIFSHFLFRENQNMYIMLQDWSSIVKRFNWFHANRQYISHFPAVGSHTYRRKCSLSRDYVNHAFCTKTSEVRGAVYTNMLKKLTFLHTIIQIWQQFLFLSDRVSLIRGIWQVCKCLILCEPLNNITLSNARALQALFYFYFSLPCFPSSERLRSFNAKICVFASYSSSYHIKWARE